MLREKIIERIELLNFYNLNYSERAKLIILLVTKKSIHSPLEDAVIALIVNLNYLDVVTKSYYQIYPKSSELLEILNTVAKTCPAGLEQAIGEKIPDTIRNIFPYFAHLHDCFINN